MSTQPQSRRRNSTPRVFGRVLLQSEPPLDPMAPSGWKVAFGTFVAASG
jgi:hypothetical protein